MGKMKVLFIAATVALASASFAPSCEECNAAAGGLLVRLTSAESIEEQTGILISQVCPQAADAAACEEARLTSAESIEEQTGILISQVCPQAADAAACEEGLAMWWGDMANCLYPAFIGASDACQRL